MARQESESSTLADDLSDIVDEVNSQLGNSLVFLNGTGGLWPQDRRIGTGSISLDLAIGMGGLPRGRMVEYHGPYSSGKSTMALLAVADAQKNGVPAVYIDAEYALDPDYMAKLGVNVDSLLVSQPRSLEHAIDVAYAAIQTGKVGLVVIDSIPALRSEVVMESDAATETRMLEARRWTAQVPRLKMAAFEHNCTLLFINQLRDPGQYQPASASNTPGGTALKFGMDVIVKFERKVESSEVKTDEALPYQQVNYKVMKNKVGSPFKGGSFYIITDSTRKTMGIDREEESILEAVRQGIIMEDTQINDDLVAVSKKGWFSMWLSPEDIALIRQDDPDVPETATFTQAFRMGPLVDKLSQWPTFFRTLEDKLYATLDRNSSSAVNPDDQEDLEAYIEEGAAANADEETVDA